MDSSHSGPWPSASPCRTSRVNAAPQRSRAGSPWSTRAPSLPSTSSWPPPARPATHHTRVSRLISASSATPTTSRSSPTSRPRSTRPSVRVEVATSSIWALRTVRSPWTMSCSLVSVHRKSGWIPRSSSPPCQSRTRGYSRKRWPSTVRPATRTKIHTAPSSGATALVSRHECLEHPRVPPPLVVLHGLRPVPPGPAQPLHGALLHGLDDGRRDRARGRLAVLPLPQDQCMERHQGSRLVQAPLSRVQAFSTCTAWRPPLACPARERTGRRHLGSHARKEQRFLWPSSENCTVPAL